MMIEAPVRGNERETCSQRAFSPGGLACSPPSLPIDEKEAEADNDRDDAGGRRNETLALSRDLERADRHLLSLLRVADAAQCQDYGTAED
jgi:hypothetical protein